MPAATSSFESSSARRRVPAGAEGRTWALAALVVAGLLGGLEVVARQAGLGRRARDDVTAWCLRATRLADEGVALLGTSRMQCDVMPSLLAEELGRPVTQLAISGSASLLVLEALARETEFRGLAIVELMPTYDLDVTRGGDPPAQACLARWQRVRAGPAERLELRLQSWAQQHLAFRDPALSLRRLPAVAARGAWPRPGAPMQADGFQPLDVARLDLAAEEAQAASGAEELGCVPGPEELAALALRYRRAIAAIRARGGEVLLLRLPSSGRVAAAEAERWPRARGWDPLAKALGSPALHWADEAGLAGFRCAEGSHLAPPDAARFTRALAEVLRQQGLARSNAAPGAPTGGGSQ